MYIGDRVESNIFASEIAIDPNNSALFFSRNMTFKREALILVYRNSDPFPLFLNKTINKWF